MMRLILLFGLLGCAGCFSVGAGVGAWMIQGRYGEVIGEMRGRMGELEQLCRYE